MINDHATCNCFRQDEFDTVARVYFDHPRQCFTLDFKIARRVGVVVRVMREYDLDILFGLSASGRRKV